MIVKGTKQLGSFKRGVNIYVPKKKIVVPAAPSGIPVASTASVVVSGFTGFDSNANGTYTKQSAGYIFSSDYADPIEILDGPAYIFVFNSATKYILLPPNSRIYAEEQGYGHYFGPFGYWAIGNITTANDGEFGYFGFSYGENDPAYNASSNNDYIPNASWSPSITITAA